MVAWLTGPTSLLGSALAINTSSVWGSTSAASQEVCTPRQEARYKWLGPEHKSGTELEAAAWVLEVAGP